VLFGNSKIAADDLVRRLVPGVLERLRRNGRHLEVPCSGNRTKWTLAVKQTLLEIGDELGYQCYDWLLDFIWWSKEEDAERMILAVESELDQRVEKEVEPDFEKLMAFKCPLKLLVFCAKVDETKKMAKRCLDRFTQHIKGEEYVFVGFAAPQQPLCFKFKVLRDGQSLPDDVKFSEITLS
jgi:hypothetical protein